MLVHWQDLLGFFDQFWVHKEKDQQTYDDDQLSDDDQPLGVLPVEIMIYSVNSKD